MFKHTLFGIGYGVGAVTLAGAAFGALNGGSIGHGGGPPGIEGAIFVGFIFLVYFGIPAAICGGVIGAAVGIIRRGKPSEPIRDEAKTGQK